MVDAASLLGLLHCLLSKDLVFPPEAFLFCYQVDLCFLSPGWFSSACRCVLMSPF